MGRRIVRKMRSHFVGTLTLKLVFDKMEITTNRLDAPGKGGAKGKAGVAKGAGAAAGAAKAGGKAKDVPWALL